MRTKTAAAVDLNSRRAVKRVKAKQPNRAPKRKSHPHLVAICALAFCLFILGLVHVWLRLQVVHMGYVLSTTTKLQGRLEQENRELKVELASLTSPDRLEAMARRRLGLMPPEKGQVLVLP
ncbi:MAG TPA: cell division protein FtsL [Candidatus Binatia bacterium]|jgi:cell division protein FtsL|nr:cell division protein FtsL [Candidatus Binatia bacterium]